MLVHSFLYAPLQRASVSFWSLPMICAVPCTKILQHIRSLRNSSAPQKLAHLKTNTCMVNAPEGACVVLMATTMPKGPCTPVRRPTGKRGVL